MTPLSKRGEAAVQLTCEPVTVKFNGAGTEYVVAGADDDHFEALSIFEAVVRAGLTRARYTTRYARVARHALHDALRARCTKRRTTRALHGALRARCTH